MELFTRKIVVTKLMLFKKAAQKFRENLALDLTNLPPEMKAVIHADFIAANAARTAQYRDAILRYNRKLGMALALTDPTKFEELQLAILNFFPNDKQTATMLAGSLAGTDGELTNEVEEAETETEEAEA